MKATVCHAWGLPDTLKVEDMPDLLPTTDQVVIAVEAAAANFPDVLIIQGKYQYKPELPFTPGSELAGTVCAVGAGVSRYLVGDREAGAAGDPG